MPATTWVENSTATNSANFWPDFDSTSSRTYTKRKPSCC